MFYGRALSRCGAPRRRGASAAHGRRHLPRQGAPGIRWSPTPSPRCSRAYAERHRHGVAGAGPPGPACRCSPSGERFSAATRAVADPLRSGIVSGGAVAGSSWLSPISWCWSQSTTRTRPCSAPADGGGTGRRGQRVGMGAADPRCPGTGLGPGPHPAGQKDHLPPDTRAGGAGVKLTPARRGWAGFATIRGTCVLVMSSGRGRFCWCGGRPALFRPAVSAAGEGSVKPASRSHNRLSPRALSPSRLRGGLGKDLSGK